MIVDLHRRMSTRGPPKSLVCLVLPRMQDGDRVNVTSNVTSNDRRNESAQACVLRESDSNGVICDKHVMTHRVLQRARCSITRLVASIAING